MTMKGEPVPPEGLDYIKGLEQWLEQYPNDVMVRSKLADLQRDPRFAEPDEPDDIIPSRCTSPPWRCWTAGPAAWSRSPERRPGDQPQPAGMAGNSPVYGPGWEFPHVVAQGVAGKPGLFLPGRTVYFCPFQPGVQQDDALRLRQGLGERAGGQESGPAGGAAGPRRLLPGKYPSRGSQRSQERPRRPPGTAGPGGRGGHPGGHPH